MPIINPLPYTIANGNPVDATPVEANLTQIVSNVNANAALVGGNASQQFLVATTTNPAGAVPLAQAQSQFAPISGSTNYAPASGSPNYTPAGGSSAQVFSVAPAASGSAQAPQIAQTIGAGASGYVNQAANRALGTTYTNSTGRPIYVIVALDYPTMPAASSAVFNVFINGTQIISDQIDNPYASTSATMYRTITFIVPPSGTYVINAVANIVIQFWSEY